MSPTTPPATPTESASRPAQRSHILACAALIVLAAAVRFVGLGAGSFWQDEALCVIDSKLPVDQLIAVLGEQNQPPGFHLLLGGWMGIVGESEFAVRSFAALCGLIAALLFASLAARMYGEATRPAALALGGLSLFWVIWSRDACMYAPFLLLATIQWRLLAEALLAPDGRHRMLPWLILGVVRGALLYVHYFTFILMAGEAGVVALVAVTRRREGASRMIVGFVLSLATSALLFAPWVPTFMEQRARVEQQWWSQPLTLGRIVNVPRQWALWLPEIDHPPWRNFMIPLAIFASAWLLGRACWRLVAGGFTRFVVVDSGAEPGAKFAPSLRLVIAFALVGVVAQMGAALVLSLGRSLMEPKYLIAASVPFYLLMLGGLRVAPDSAASGRLRPGGWLDATVLGVFLAMQLGGLMLATRHPGYGYQDTRAAATLIVENFQRGDAIVTISPSTFAPMYHYLLASNSAYPLFFYLGEGGTPPPFYEGLGALPRASYINDAELLAAGQERLWLLYPTWRDRDWEYTDRWRAHEAQVVHTLHHVLAGTEPTPEPFARFTRLEIYLIPVEREFDRDETWRKWAEWKASWEEDQRSSALGRFLQPEEPAGGAASSAE